MARRPGKPVKLAQKAVAARKLMDAINTSQQERAARAAATPGDVAEEVLNALARGASWTEVEALVGTFPHGVRPPTMSASALIDWAVQIHMPGEVVKRGRNIILERYRQMIDVLWPRVTEGELAAITEVRNICKEIRTMTGLDSPEHKVVTLKPLEDMTDDELRYILGEGAGTLAGEKPAGTA